MAGVPEVRFLISHQRSETTAVPGDSQLPPLTTQTVWLPTNASWPSAKRREAARNMGRSPVASTRSLLGSGTHARVVTQGGEKAGGLSVPARVKVVLAGV